MTESKQLRNKELPLHLCCCHRFVGVLGDLFLNTRVETASKNLKKKEKKVIHRVIETRTCEMLCWQFDPEFPFASQKNKKQKNKKISSFKIKFKSQQSALPNDQRLSSGVLLSVCENAGL